MRKIIGLSILSFLSISTSYAVSAPINGTYVGFTFGASYIPEIKDLDVPISSILSNTAISALEPNLGANLGMTIGRRFKDRYRLEVEFISAYNAYKDTTLTGSAITVDSNFTTKGYLSTFTAVYLNAYVDLFSLTGDYHKASPYIGIGIGKAYAVIKSELYDNDIFVSNLINSKESVPVVQLVFGVSYFLDDFTSIGLDIQMQKYSTVASINKSYQQTNLNLTMKTTLGD